MCILAINGGYCLESFHFFVNSHATLDLVGLFLVHVSLLDLDHLPVKVCGNSWPSTLRNELCFPVAIFFDLFLD